MSKGAFKYGAGKRMSGSTAGLTGKGKMSSAHGTTGQSKNNNMNRTTGGDMVGAGTRTFNSGIKQFSGEKGGPKHASQPSGHKSKA